MLHEARQVAEADVDDLDTLISEHPEHVGRTAFLHHSSSRPDAVTMPPVSYSPVALP
jgi:hypothetical protein